MPAKSPAPPPLDKADFEALSEFRYQLRRFLHFSEKAARGEGITPLQYQVLLQIVGFPGRDWANVGELAERLQMQPHGMVALLSRCEALGLLVRSPSATDHRKVEVRLLPAGQEVLKRLARRHQAELRSLQGIFGVASLTAFNDNDK